MKILSNKKYHELLLKSCKGMFGAVTDDMLLRNNAFLTKEKEQLQDELQRKDNIIILLKKWLEEQLLMETPLYGWTFKSMLNKINELEGDSK